MSTSKSRKKHSSEFKAQLVLEMLKEEKSVTELASEHGIHATQLHRWRKEFMDNLPQVFARRDSWTSEKAKYDEKIEGLYTEIGRLSAQLSWLKKKSHLFEP